MPGSGSKQQVGARGEDLACAELTRQGLTIVERNWRCSVGELDIVARVGRRHAGVLRGEVSHRARVRPPAGGDHLRQAPDAAAAGGEWMRSTTASAHRASGIDAIGVAHAARPGADRHPRQGGRLMRRGVRLVGRPDRAGGQDHRGRGRHRGGPAAYGAGRAARQRALPVPRPVQGGGQQLRPGVADLAAHHQPVARPRCPRRAPTTTWPSSRRSWRRPGGVPTARAAPDGAARASWAWTGGSGRSGASCPPRWPRSRPGSRGWWCPLRQAGEAKLVGGHRGRRHRLDQPAGRLPARRADARGRADRGAGATRRAPMRPASSTWPTWSVRSRPSGPARWRRPAGTTCCSTARPGWARRCWPSGSRACCPDLDLHDSLEVSAVHSLAGFNLDDRLDRPSAVQRPAPLGLGGQHRRRRAADGQARRDLLRPQGRAVPGRGARVRPAGARRAADAAGVGHDQPRPERGQRPLSGALPADPGGQPLPVRAGGDGRRVVSLPADGGASLRREDQRADPGPDRHQPGVPAAAEGVS